MRDVVVVILFGAIGETSELFSASQAYANTLSDTYKSMGISSIKLPVYDIDDIDGDISNIEARLSKKLIFLNAVLGPYGYNGEVVDKIQIGNTRLFVGCGSQHQVICNDKYLTKQLLSLEGIPVAEGFLVVGSQDFYTYNTFPKYIAKPNFGSRSKNIQIVDSSETEYIHLSEGVWIIEEFLEGDDVTVLCMNGNYYAAKIKTEDGIHTNEHKETQLAIFEKFEGQGVIDTCLRVREALGISYESIRIDGRYHNGKYTVLEVNTQTSWAWNSTGGKTWQVNNPGDAYAAMLLELLEEVEG